MSEMRKKTCEFVAYSADVCDLSVSFSSEKVTISDVRESVIETARALMRAWWPKDMRIGMTVIVEQWDYVYGCNEWRESACFDVRFIGKSLRLKSVERTPLIKPIRNRKLRHEP